MSESIALRHAASTIILLQSIIRNLQDEIANAIPVSEENLIPIPIRPFQALVDFLSIVATGFTDNVLWQTPNQGITYLSPFLITTYATGTGGGDFDFSGNAIENIDEILAAFALTAEINPNTTLNLSGGTNAIPTGGDENADLVILRASNWVVTINL